MRRTRPRSLAEIMGDGGLAGLAREAERRRGLTERVRGLLPPEAASHLITAGTGENGDLVLVMDSAAWAARVRYYVQVLGEKAVRVKVGPGGTT